MATKQTFSSFQDMVSGSELPLLVDFYAPWCGPCQLMAKILEQVHTQFGTQLRIVKINTDNYPAIASQYQIQALPTLMVFKNGEPIDRIEGVLPVERLTAHLASLL
jgi:thioredoxin